MAEAGGQPWGQLASARQSIADVQDRYAALYDGRRPREFAQMFTAAGVLEFPDGQRVIGHDALARFAERAARSRASTHHFIAARRITVDDADHAHGHAYMTAVSTLGASVRLLVMGRYEDDFRRETGGWLIAFRRIVALDEADLPVS